MIKCIKFTSQLSDTFTLDKIKNCERKNICVKNWVKITKRKSEKKKIQILANWNSQFLSLSHPRTSIKDDMLSEHFIGTLIHAHVHDSKIFCTFKNEMINENAHHHVRVFISFFYAIWVSFGGLNKKYNVKWAFIYF